MKTVWSFLFRKQVRWHVPSHLTVSHAEIESILSVLGNLEMLPSVRLHAVMSRRPLWTKNCRIFGRPLFFFFFFPRYGRLQQLSLIFVSHVSVLASLRSIPPTASPLIYLVSTIPSLAGRPAYFSLRLDRRHLVPADIYPILDFTLKYSVQELFRLFFEYPRLRYANHGVQRRIALGPSSLQETTGRER